MVCKQLLENARVYDAGHARAFFHPANALDSKRISGQKGNAFFHPANALNSKRISGQKGNLKVFNAPDGGSR
jgi:hypothetical protein